MTAGISVDWRDDVPIWKQIKDRLQAAIMEGNFKEGEAIPSVRTLALELAVNPLTVSRAFSELADDGLIEKRRGLGMFVTFGKKDALLERERAAFLQSEWPEILKRIKQLGLSAKDLLDKEAETFANN